MALVPYKPLCLNEILDYGSRFETSLITDFNMDDFINVELYTGENDGFVGLDRDGDFDSGFHMDVDVDVDISESVQAHPCSVSDSQNGDMNIHVFVDGDIDPVAKGVATLDTT